MVPGGKRAAGAAAADPTAGPAPGAPARAAQLDDALLVDALSRLAGAASRAAAAEAVVPPLLEVEGVRAVAVVLRDGDRALIVGSGGYGCGAMSVGQVLPLDAGLPVTEAVRTGRTVVQGSGPSWVAVPFGSRAGALLLSLTSAPPPALVRLQRLARTVGDALHRAEEQERAAADLAVLTALLSVPLVTPDVTCRTRPWSGAAGGDVVVCLPDGRGGRWLVVADVCGSGMPAAVVAQGVQAAFTALLPYADGPAALLADVDRALRATVSPGLFVTAVAAHEQQGRLRVASAGHPPLLLLRPGGAHPVEVDPGLPLALEGGSASVRAQAEVRLEPGDVLLLHTDGLLDRRGCAGPCTADLQQLLAGRPLDDLERLADDVLDAAADVGAAGDDVTLVLVRTRTG